MGYKLWHLCKNNRVSKLSYLDCFKKYAYDKVYANYQYYDKRHCAVRPRAFLVKFICKIFSRMGVTFRDEFSDGN